MQSAISIMAVAAFALIFPLSACSLDSTDPIEEHLEEPAPAKEIAELIEEANDQAVSYSKVEYCDASGTDGTRCLQQGGTIGAAQYECVIESQNVCGTPKCPWVFVANNAARERFYKGYCVGYPNRNWISEKDPIVQP